MPTKRLATLLLVTPLLLAGSTAFAQEREHRRAGVRGVLGHDAQCRTGYEEYHKPRFQRERRCGCSKRWVAGHYVYRTVQVRDRGCYRSVWVPARYETRRIGCRTVRVLVSHGHYKQVYTPGPLREVRKKVWVPGRYRTVSCGKHRHGRRHR